MEWHKTGKERPNPGEEVSIQIGQTFHLAEYLETDRVFLTRSRSVIPAESVYWAHITPPESE